MFFPSIHFLIQFVHSFCPFCPFILVTASIHSIHFVHSFIIWPSLNQFARKFENVCLNSTFDSLETSRHQDIKTSTLKSKIKDLEFHSRSKINFTITTKCPLCGHILAPPEGLRAPELPWVNPGGQPLKRFFLSYERCFPFEITKIFRFWNENNFPISNWNNFFSLKWQISCYHMALIS